MNKKSIYPHAITIFVLFLLVLLVNALFRGETKAASPEMERVSNVQEEAFTLYEIGIKYQKAKKSSDYKTLYSYQHPLFCRVVPLKDYVENRGRILLDVNKMNEKNQIPLKHIYLDNTIRIVSSGIKSVSIAKNRKYGKIENFYVKEIEPPVLISLPKPLRVEFETVDYWEKIMDRWYIISKIRVLPDAHLSGNVTINEDKSILFPEETVTYETADIKILRSRHRVQ